MKCRQRDWMEWERGGQYDVRKRIRERKRGFLLTAKRL
jgi:hypothetical protein